MALRETPDLKVGGSIPFGLICFFLRFHSSHLKKATALRLQPSSKDSHLDGINGPCAHLAFARAVTAQCAEILGRVLRDCQAGNLHFGTLF